MKIRSRLALATVLSVLFLAVPGILLLYSLASSRLLHEEALHLRERTQEIVNDLDERLQEGGTSLAALHEALQAELYKPAHEGELDAFGQEFEAGADGIIRNRAGNFDGTREAGVFAPPASATTDAQQRFLLRTKRVLELFGRRNLPELTNTWLLTRDRVEIIFDRNEPDFVFNTDARQDYTGTPWVQLASPESNPERVARWTSVSFDPVPRKWMVSIVLPLVLDGKWVGSIGHDVTLDRLTVALGRGVTHAKRTQHFLLDKDGNFILAGPWQAELEHSPELFKPDLARESELAVLLGKSSAGDADTDRSNVVRFQGDSYLATWHSLAPGWRYYRLMAADAALEPIDSMIGAGIKVLALVLLITGAAVVLLTNRILVRPLLNLTAVARAYGSGQTQTRVNQTGNDELAELAASFDAMADGLERNQFELQQREARYRSLVKGIREVIFQLDDEANWVFLSDTWVSLSEYSVEEALGRCLYEFVAGEDVNALRRQFHTLVSGGADSCRSEFRLCTRSGERVWVEFVAQLAKAEDDVTVFTGTIDDISWRYYHDEVSALLRRAEESIGDGHRSEQLLQFFCEKFSWLFGFPLVTAALRRENRIAVVGRSDGADCRFGTSSGLRDSVRGFSRELELYIRAFDEGRTLMANSDASAADDIAVAGLKILVPVKVQDQLELLLAFYVSTNTPYSPERVERLESLSRRVSDVLRRAENAQWLHLQRTALQSVANGIMIVDTGHEVIWVNPAMETLTGYSAAEMIGRSPRFLSTGLTADTKSTEVVETLRRGGIWSDEVVNRRKDGSLYTVRETVTALTDASGRLTHYVAVFADITALKNAEARLQHMATHDALTGLSNRVLFRERLKDAFSLAARAGQSVAVLLLDLDRFKTINDTLGHLRADELLQAVAGRLQRCLREHDTVARLGGDEFTIMLPALENSEHAAYVAGKVLTALSEPFLIGEQTVITTTSIGISIFPDDGEDIDEILQRADAAMYQSKALGRNTYQYYTRAIHERSMQRLRVEKELRRAIEQDEFALFYQPIADTRSGTIVGAEALLRWMHPVRGLLTPEVFIDIAEDSGLILPIGDWVLRVACLQAAAWEQEGIRDFELSVNLSTRQFRRSDLVDCVARACAHAGFSSRNVNIELTESLMMEDMEQGISTMRKLKELGAKLCIDDFGMGYSSLSYLKRFPLDTLKIDRSFIDTVPQNPEATAIASTILAMARTLGLGVVAEGVENEAQLEFLRALGCPRYQGYLLAEPMRAEELAKLLRRSRGRQPELVVTSPPSSAA